MGKQNVNILQFKTRSFIKTLRSTTTRITTKVWIPIIYFYSWISSHFRLISEPNAKNKSDDDNLSTMFNYYDLRFSHRCFFLSVE